MYRRAGIFEERGVVALDTIYMEQFMRAIVPSASDTLKTLVFRTTEANLIKTQLHFYRFAYRSH